MTSQAKTPDEYIAELPEERRGPISKMRAVIRKNLPKGMVETMGYGMISYVIPHKLYPAGYHCDPKLPLPYVSLASQKNYIALHVMPVYMDPKLEAWVREAFAKAGKKLDMGKACLRLKKVEDAPLDVLGELVGKLSVADYIVLYEDMLRLGAANRTNRVNNSKNPNL